MDTLLRQIAVALCSSAIVWAIWFFIAKSKNNHKQMVYATVFCCFVFFTMAFSPLAGAAFYGAYALINYVKKMGDAPTQAPQEPQQMQIPLPEETKETPTKQQRPEHEQKEEKHFTDTLAYPLLWIAIIALMAYLFFLLLSN